MKLSGIVAFRPEPASALPEGPEVISADTDLLQLTEEQFAALPDKITVADTVHSSIAYIEKDFLKYIRQNCLPENLITMLENAPVGIVAIDNESRIFYVNKTYSQILGVPRHRVLGQRMDMLEPNAIILNVIREQKKVINQTVWISSIERYVSVNITSLEKGGEIRGAISFFIDETEKNQLAGELNKAKGLVNHYQKELELKLELPKDFTSINTRNARYLQVLRTASVIAPTDTSVLIQGEHGVGKEVLARAIHRASLRSARPFITVNCAAIPDNLFEAELFGHEEKTLPGGRRHRGIGKFELADKGILFLDEIGEMPLAIQAKLLHLLHDQEIDKDGERAGKPDVRIIAATNQNLEQMAKDGLFRTDLLYQLNVASLHIPSLRERQNDIDPLIDEFVGRFNQKYDKRISLSPNVRYLLQQHSWPGNIRELSNTLEYAVIMCSASILLPEHLPPQFSEHIAETPQKYIALDRGWKETLHEVEKSLLENALNSSNGNRSEAMRRLGLSRKVFYSKLKLHSLM